MDNRFVVAACGPFAPAVFSSATAVEWFSVFAVVPVRRNQTASLELIPLITAFELAAL